MKAQSDLMGDHESAAEMTAPRICGVTIWVDSAVNPFDTLQDCTLNFTALVDWANDKSAKFVNALGRLTKPYTDMHNKLSEVATLPPMTVTP